MSVAHTLVSLGTKLLQLSAQLLIGSPGTHPDSSCFEGTGTPYLRLHKKLQQLRAHACTDKRKIGDKIDSI